MPLPRLARRPRRRLASAVGPPLLGDLIDHATQPQFVYRHMWRPHDFVIWDNRCTMHRARPLDDKTHRRELRRTMSRDLPLPVSA